MTRKVALAIALSVVVVWVVSATCEDCDTAARHFLRQLFRAMF
jgi:hypothetical protein